HGAVRGHRRPVVRGRGRGRALRRPQQRRGGRGGGHRRPRLRVHDRRHRGGPGTGGPQLRRRHDRRPGLHLRSLRAPGAPGQRFVRADRAGGPRVGCRAGTAGADPGARGRHRQPAGPAAPGGVAPGTGALPPRGAPEAAAAGAGGAAGRQRGRGQVGGGGGPGANRAFVIATLLQNSVLSQGGVLAQGAAAAHGAVLAQAASAPYPAVLSYAALGLTMGMAAAFSPGPLQALVIAESARRGWRAGALVALAPLLSDAVMAPAAVLLAGSLSSGWLRVATAAGAAMLARLGWGAVTGAGRETVAAAGAAAAPAA